MTKKLIIFATFGEAEPSIIKLGAKAIPGTTATLWNEEEVPTCYHFEKGLIVLADVGIHAAQHAVSKHHHDYDEVWNIGIAGALSDHFPIGALVEIERVGKHVPHPEDLDDRSRNIIGGTIPPLELEATGGWLVSSDFPIHHNEQRAHLSQQWDLVDMEGYGVAYAAKNFDKPCRLWKIVSDFASPRGRELIRKHKKELAGDIADFLFIRLGIEKNHTKEY